MSDNSQSAIHRLALGLMSAALLLAACTRAEDARIHVSGSVVDDVTTIAVPRLPTFELDSLVGSASSSDATATPASQDEEESGSETVLVTGANTRIAEAPDVKWQRVEEVFVRTGEKVRSGQVLARLDSKEASAAVAGAIADIRRAEADVTLIASRTADVSQGRTEVASKTAELETTITELEQQRADLQSQLDAARASLPPAGSSETSIPPDVAASIARLEDAIAQLDTALVEARAGLETLHETTATLQDSESALAAVKSVAGAVLDARRAALAVVEAQRGLSTVVAPLDGVILEIASRGQVLASGAPLARLRPEARPKIRTYLTAEQAESVREGSSAQISLDSLPDRTYVGLLATVGTRYEYVPTTFATGIVHLTRGFEVIFEVYDAPELPAGTPVDLIVNP